MEPDAETVQTVVFTDLDGTLLDAATYSAAAAGEALAALRRRGIPLVLVSSKTRAEIEPIRRDLALSTPFIVENGGAVFVPAGCFETTPPQAVGRDGYQVIELGRPYGELRRALGELARATGEPLRGFGEMSVDEVAARTGLSRDEAARAKQREYDEAFVFEGAPDRWGAFSRQAEARGLRCTRGGRFHHLMGPHDKGRACRLLLDCYRRQRGPRGAVRAIALGDSLNDLPMLEAADLPVLVQRPDGSYDPEVRLPRLRFAPGVGPLGWNRAVLSLLGET